MAETEPLPDTGAHAVATAHGRAIGARLWQAVRAVATSEVGAKFRLLFASILALLLGIAGLNVVNSYVGRNLFTALEQRNIATFVSMTALWIAVFAALTTAAVILRFFEERLGLLWRDWLTRDLVRAYLDGRVYLHVKEQGALDNPDQRISEDTRAFTTITLSFALLFLNAIFTIAAFSSVLWSISRLLFLVALAYAALGSLLTVVLGHRLIGLNHDQLDREASFRAELVHVGQNAESVALLKLEDRVGARLGKRLDALVANFKHIVAVNRNLGFFTTGYSYGIQLVPPLIVGPLFIRGDVQFGVITQSAMAFAQLLGAFSLIVTQFQSISSYAAVLTRLGNFATAVERARAPAPSRPDATTASQGLVLDDLTLRSTSTGEPLVSHLSLTVTAGTRLLVTGTDEARRELFRAMALGRPHDGRIVSPGAERVLFLPERPYVPFGTMRELLVGAKHERTVREDELLAVLRELELDLVLKRLGGLDVERDFSHDLSLGEQQLCAFAHVTLAKPAFVVLQSPGATLAPEQLARALRLLSHASISYLTFGGLSALPSAYDSVLEIHAGGSWNLRAYSNPLAASAGAGDGRLDIREARSEVMGAT
jgi:putative ATP-binding cassette transporter